MVQIIEYVTKERFDELRKLYPKANYSHSFEWGSSECLTFLFVDKRLAVVIKCELD